MRLAVFLLLGISGIVGNASGARTTVTPRRLVIASVMADDSLSWAIADRAATALRNRVDSSRFVVLRSADLRTFLSSHRYAEGMNTADVRELMKALKADAFVDVQAALSGSTVLFSALQFEGVSGAGSRGPLLATSSTHAAADALATRLARDTSFVGPR